MGTDRKTPLSEAGAPGPGRSQTTQQRSKVARTRLIVGGVVALAVVGGAAFLATRGGDDGVLGEILGGGSDRPVPEVTLAVKDTSFESTSADADKDAQADTADRVSEEVVDALEVMLRTAYVDPGTWDDAGAVADAFAGDAAGRIEADAAVMTLGEDAGDVYGYVEPSKGTVSVEVLTDADANPVRVYARVSFAGLAEHDDGTYTKVAIDGSYFLIHDDGAWRIDSYRVDRQEKAAKPPATASATATPEETSG